MAEEGGADGDEGDERPQGHDHRIVGDIGEVGEHRDVLGLGLGQLGRREAQHAGEDEEQHEAHQHDGGVAQDQTALCFRLLAVLPALYVGKAGDGGGVAEGEHGDRQRQPDGVEEAAALQAAQLRPLPLGDQVAGERRQDGRQRIDHDGKGAQHRLLAGQHHGDHGEHQQAGEHHPVRGIHAELIDHEALHRVGQPDPVDEQDREDGEEVKRRDEAAGHLAEMLLGNLGEVGVGARRGEYEARQPAVGQEGHGAGQHGDDDKGPDPAQTQIDGQEQDAGTDGGAKQADDPVGVVAAPGGGADSGGAGTGQILGDVYR